MAYRRLLLPLTGTAAGEAALATALMVARVWNAHVHCLHVRVDARDVAPLAGEGLSGAMIEEMMERQWLKQRYPILEVRGAVRNDLKGLLPTETIGAVVRWVYKENDVPWREEWNRNSKQKTLEQPKAASTESEESSSDKSLVTTTPSIPATGSEPQKGGKGNGRLQPLKMEFKDELGMKQRLVLDRWARIK